MAAFMSHLLFKFKYFKSKELIGTWYQNYSFGDNIDRQELKKSEVLGTVNGVHSSQEFQFWWIYFIVKFQH